MVVHPPIELELTPIDSLTDDTAEPTLSDEPMHVDTASAAVAL